jgi:hypothetical protein
LVVSIVLFVMPIGLPLPAMAHGAAPDEFVVSGRFLEPKSDGPTAHRHSRVYGRVDKQHGLFDVSGSDAIDWPLDSEGRFRQRIPREGPGVVLDFWFELHDELGGFETGFHVGMPVNEATGRADSDRIELGDLEFPTSRTIAAGRVIDRAGKAIAGALVMLREDVEAPPNYTVRVQEAIAPAKRRRPDPEPELAPISELDRIQTFSSADGSFRILSPFATPGCRIEVHVDGCFDASAKIPASGPVTIRMVAPSSIPGHVDFDTSDWRIELVAEAVEVGVARDHDSPLHRNSGSDSIDRDGNFRIQMLRAGTYDIYVRQNWAHELELIAWAYAWANDGQPELLGCIHRVVVREGETVDDPRLRQFSFHRRKRPVSIRIVAPDQKRDDVSGEIPNGPFGDLFGIDVKGNRIAWSTAFWNGEAKVRPRVEVERIEVCVDGFRSEVIDNLTRDATVRLRPGIPVRIVVLPEHLPCPLEGQLTASSEQREAYPRRGLFADDIGHYGRAEDEGSATPNPDLHPGVLLFALSNPGVYELKLWDPRDDMLLAIPRESAMLDVKDSADVQTFEIHLDPDVVRSLRNE